MNAYCYKPWPLHQSLSHRAAEILSIPLFLALLKEMCWSLIELHFFCIVSKKTLPHRNREFQFFDRAVRTPHFEILVSLFDVLHCQRVDLRGGRRVRRRARSDNGDVWRRGRGGGVRGGRTGLLSRANLPPKPPKYWFFYRFSRFHRQTKMQRIEAKTSSILKQLRLSPLFLEKKKTWLLLFFYSEQSLFGGVEMTKISIANYNRNRAK